MFEAHVLHLLRRYLGEYVEGLSVEALRISVWQGDVVLKDLKLKAEALNSLKLPVTVKAGFIGTITLKVPWKSVGKEPVIVLIDRVFILAHPVTDDRTLKQSNGNSWLGSLIATIIGNLKISISNVHIRYEDLSGHPFCSGATLAKLAAVTMDEEGNETFDTSGALDKLRKVHMILWEGDMTLKTKLHSLKIKDELQGRLSTTPQYLACSVLKSDNLVSSPGIIAPHWKEMSVLLHEEDDNFTDALPDFMSVSDAGFGSPTSDTVSCVTTEDINDAAGFASAEGLVLEKNLVKARCISAEEFYEAEGSDYSNFVSLTFSTLSSSSPHYDGIDAQMSIRMSKLEFFCNRPTLVALIVFGLDLSSVYSEESTADITEGSGDKSLTNKEKTEEIGRVKGLLGYGKGRVVFYLNMNVDSVTVSQQGGCFSACDVCARKFCARSEGPPKFSFH
ncbi:uncharacterized protein LOC133708161 [Rosa rugosa]|uniref:uncharacterized protein LOC133708161 n=1 Tax=Rosa rugosa TaxID=74645 RepID=UPI002B40BD83|nr:uncharacterized protein LOC133708161 [Rosa rugosa]XP_061989599.1 uncharacterized protein LOC133708161 [Rosa rugosa]